MKKIIIALSVIVGFVAGVNTLSVTAAGGCVTPPNGWSGPGGTPPSSNVCPPINTGSSWQIKAVTPGSGGIGIGNGATQLASGVFNVVGGSLFDKITTDAFSLIGSTAAPQDMTAKNVLVDMTGDGTATWQPLSAITAPSGGTTNVFTNVSSGPGYTVNTSNKFFSVENVSSAGSISIPVTSVTLASDADVMITGQTSPYFMTGIAGSRLILTVDGNDTDLGFGEVYSFAGSPPQGQFNLVGSEAMHLTAGTHHLSMKAVATTGNIYVSCVAAGAAGNGNGALCGPNENSEARLTVISL